MTLAWICAGLIAGTPTTDPTPPPDSAAAYREAREKAGRSPDEQVKLALWCEARGLTAERLHHLTLAVLADPGNAAARGLLGLVAHEGRWRRPEAVADRVKADPDRSATLAEYELKRQKAAYTADAQWALGTWAAEHGLPEQAKAHLTAVIRLDPSREDAWKRLGYKKRDGRWATDAQLAAEKAEADAQKAADRRWKPLLEKYQGMLNQPSRRDEADAALAGVTDPRAVPSILHAFGTNRAGDQLRAVQLLGQVDSPSASRALAGLAVLAKSAEVRRAALETLKGRDPRDFVRLWIALVRKPIRYEVRPVGGPGSPGSLFVEGEKANLRRVYSPPAMPNVPNIPGMVLAYDDYGLPVLIKDLGKFRDRSAAASGAAIAQADANRTAAFSHQLDAFVNRFPGPSGQAAAHVTASAFAQQPDPYKNVAIGNGVPVRPNLNESYTPFRDFQYEIPIGQMMVEAQQEAQVARQQLASDVASIERANAAIVQSNEATLSALRAITGKDFGDDPAPWAKWWTDVQGYAITSSTPTVPTIVEEVPINYIPQATPTLIAGPLLGFTTSHSCFAAGTSVRTIDGSRAIESIRAGDLVLVQDAKTGGLGYRAVVAAFHNPPSPTLKVKLGEADAVVATGIHRFWKAGKGWTMARDLKAGDLVRTLGGAATVSAVEVDRIQPVFNLEVAEGHSFLVGRPGALVHDNSLVEATPAPFDAGAMAAK